MIQTLQLKKNLFIISEIKQLNYSHPSDWEGKLTDGKSFYIRCRYDYFSIESHDGFEFSRNYEYLEKLFPSFSDYIDKKMLMRF